METLAQFLIQKCEEQNLSWRSASKKASLDHDAISRYVNGSRPTRKNCLKLASFFAVPEDYVLMLAGHIIRPQVFTPQTQIEWQLLDKFRSLSPERQAIVLRQLDLELGLDSADEG